MNPDTEKRLNRTPRYLILGLLTLTPLWVTWLVFDFVYTQLSSIGGPWVSTLAQALAADQPADADFLLRPAFQSALGVVLTLVVLYLIGWLASNVIGQRIIHHLERIVLRTPVVAAIYGDTKRLLAAIKDALPRLEQMWQQANSHWGYEDPVYRFYHQSFKVYHLQADTAEIVKALQDLAPHLPLNPWFMRIVGEGTAGEFSMEVNQRWLEATRPILEAFFHARYYLEMVWKYGKELREQSS